jgi:hypothetical protein
MHQFHQFILSWNSTCFGQFFCPSWGVYSLYTRQWYMSYRFVDSFRAVPGWNCSSILVLLESCHTLADIMDLYVCMESSACGMRLGYRGQYSGWLWDGWFGIRTLDYWFFLFLLFHRAFWRFAEYGTPTNVLILNYTYISLKLFALKYFHCFYIFR